MFWKLLPARAILIGLILAGILAVIFYLTVYRGVDLLARQQVFKKQEIMVNAQKSNLLSFFDAFGNSVALLSQLDSIKNSSSSANIRLDEFVEQWRDSGIVGGVVLTDAEGKVIFNSNISGTKDTGALLADRDYYVWAKTSPQRGEYFVGRPV